MYTKEELEQMEAGQLMAIAQQFGVKVSQTQFWAECANKADSKQRFYKCPLIIWTVLTNKNEKVDKKMGKKLRISPIF